MSMYDFSDSAAINIDTIMDTIVASRKESGIGGYPEEAVVDDQTGRRYRRFQKRSKEEEKIFQELKEERKKTADASSKGNYKIDLRSIQGLGVYDRLVHGDNDDYDTAPPFICTFCGKLGRARKYTPVVCDSCSECLSCNQFAKKECSGCEYSRWREGIPYGKLIGKTSTMDDVDLEILQEVMNNKGDSSPTTFKDIQITGWSVTD